MDITIEVDLGQVARELNLPVESVQRTVSLLDEGNTVPFITRYRKDRTGALDEEQIRRVQEKVGKLRGLVERKQTILRSLHAQGVLSAELSDLIRHATSLKRLEDLYLPFKPKKQTLATVARQRGLEPLAVEVLEADPAAGDLRQRAESYVDLEKELPDVDGVLQGVQHIIAEGFSERADVRGRLRKILRRTGKLVCSRVENPKPESPTESDSNEASPTGTGTEPADTTEVAAPGESAPESAGEPAPATGSPTAPTAAGVPEATGEPQSDEPQRDEPRSGDESSSEPGSDEPGNDEPGGAQPPSQQTGPDASPDAATEPVETPAAGPNSDGEAPPPRKSEEISAADVPDSPVESDVDVIAQPAAEQSVPAVPAPTDPAPTDPAPTDPAPTDPTPAASAPAEETVEHKAVAAASVTQSKSFGSAPKGKAKRGPLSTAMTKKEKKRQRLEAAFKDYYDFQESVSRIPPHRVLAINRGERSRILRVKMDADMESMAAEAESLLIPPDGHPHREFLRCCIRDALNRLLMPSLERELRREMTEKAEEHAVDVFARNLRKLLLQPPVHHHRMLAVDPGFRSGCKLIALDEFGNVLNHEIIHVIGKDEWIRKGRAKLVNLIQRHQLSVIAIGNGAACRETEQLVVDVMEKELKDQDIAFVIVNEAGASVYSTSPLGREELPTYDAVLRSAISIGRRLLDPLSELVKINPANIGVGMYQHDVKAKHLRTSLDAVVESCVNYVGVDVNTASPALLRYVSGMNQLTARRLCEYRASNGPFGDREQLKQVPGLGEATFVQAAGFLKISDGRNPLDATWIHPESYELARKVLEAAGCDVEDLRTREVAPEPNSNEFGKLGTSDESVAPGATVEPSAPGMGETVEPSVETGVPIAGTGVPEPGALANADGPASEPSSIETESTESAEAEPSLSPPEEGARQDVVEKRSEEQAISGAVEKSGPVSDASSDAAGEPTGEAKPLTAEPEPAAPAVASGDSGAERLQILYEKVHQLSVDSLAEQWSVSKIVLQDVLDSLARPGRDPREDLPAPVFRRGIVKLEDLEPGMRLSGTVLNVVDFGAFVDIGLTDSGLVHISRLADRFVRDPHEVVGVGDVLTVWVVDIDKQRRRVSLTAIEPGTEKPPEVRRRADKPRSRKPAVKRSHAAKGSHEGKDKGKGRPPRDKGHKSRPPRKPKIVTPITKEMEDGTEPLRSFSDLMQFYQKKQSDEDESKS